MTVNRDRQRKLAARERRQEALQRANAEGPHEEIETTGPEESGTANNEGARRRGRKPKVKES